MITPADEVASLRASLHAALIGKAEAADLALCAAIAGGHVLLDDVPGVGKTALALGLAAALGGRFHRIQFTADLLPADVTGGLVADRDGLSFRPGPVFANVVLADEINRAPPRTQSALFEAMSDGRVSVDGVSHPLPAPFLVVATRNPWEQHGVFPLPEAQLDRFLMRISLGYPSRELERRLLAANPMPPAPADGAPSDAWRRLRAAVAEVRTTRVLEDYVLDLVSVTRSDRRFVRGVSPRGAQALWRAARARAVLDGRDYLAPEDVRAVAVATLAHRVAVRGTGEADAAILAVLRELRAP